VLAAAGAGAYIVLNDDDDSEGGESAASGDVSNHGDKGSGESGVTKADFIAKADALCAGASKKFGALTEPATPEEAGPFLTDAIAINESLFADLSALEAPAGDNGEVDLVLGGLKKLTGQMKTLLASIEAQDAQAIQTNYDQLGTVTDEANAAAVEYGLVTCAS
jgi:hypothetical protein